MLDFDQYRVLTFDCYGTLIDWESGILRAIRPILSAHGITVKDDALLEAHGELEAEIEGDAYRPYRQVLREVVAGLGMQWNFSPSAQEMESLPESVRNWLPFPDTVAALRILKRQYKLAIVSNIDDDLFAVTAPKLGVQFDYVITAEQARSYKPSRNNFNIALHRIGLPVEQVLHVAQSLFHDVEPAKSLGLDTVWVNRRAGLAGFGATKPAEARPDLEVPDLLSLAMLAVEEEEPPRTTIQ